MLTVGMLMVGMLMVGMLTVGMLTVGMLMVGWPRVCGYKGYMGNLYTFLSILL